MHHDNSTHVLLPAAELPVASGIRSSNISSERELSQLSNGNVAESVLGPGNETEKVEKSWNSFPEISRSSILVEFDCGVLSFFKKFFIFTIRFLDVSDDFKSSDTHF